MNSKKLNCNLVLPIMVLFNNYIIEMQLLSIFASLITKNGRLEIEINELSWKTTIEKKEAFEKL